MIDLTQAVKIFIEQVYYQVYQTAIHSMGGYCRKIRPKG